MNTTVYVGSVQNAFICARIGLRCAATAASAAAAAVTAATAATVQK